MSTESRHPIFDKWLVVQAKAHQAELIVMRAQIQEAVGAGPVPPDLLEHARTLRMRASILVPEALAEMARLADSVRWRPDEQDQEMERIARAASAHHAE
ncbi:hypothetical protein EZ313_19395 [Ramlibacter henchirensis]|uniref:Uncharacterized protein n=1 Tax=Ramlibacter henchirensis TaxID=204072 RepID=A0A4Z0BQF4_9BURK|nr:hypothetical protein [Ramlibacter henchirensis]TFZ00620.1 hypothetical protein EZ313_19395 [Ramlibacter henchirensis]